MGSGHRPPRNGDHGTVVEAAPAAIIASSPIAAASRHHGYRLQLDGIARLTVDEATHLRAHVDEMSVTAHEVICRS